MADLTVPEVAAELRMSEWWVKAQCRPLLDEDGRMIRKAVPHQRYGRRIRFTPDQVDLLRARCAQGGNESPTVRLTARKKKAR